jgi:ABC-type proline/glycine betaine transport system permease subunit
MIFGGSPVVRLTVLGLRGVPESVREAARAFGASKRYLLWKVDIPLALPSIMAGINQTILLSLAMVVIASLIGAKGLGEHVLIPTAPALLNAIKHATGVRICSVPVTPSKLRHAIKGRDNE